MNWNALYAVFTAIFNYAILIGLFLLLVLWYRRSGKQHVEHTSNMEKVWSEVMRANAESARQAAESARMAVETVHNLVALLSKEPNP